MNLDVVRPMGQRIWRCAPPGMGYSFGVGGRAGKTPTSGTFDPATLNLSGWWRASYTGAPWVANASAGASLANGNMVTNASDPSTGTAQNGYTPPDFDGAANNLTNPTDAATLFSTTAGTIIALVWIDSAAAASGNIYDDAAIYHDANADFGLTVTANGPNADITGFAYDGGYQPKAVTCSLSAYHLVMMRVNGTNLGMTLDSAGEVTQPCGTLAVLTGAAQIGKGYAATYFDGRILELMTSNTVLTPTDYANVKSYVNARYALSV